MPLAEKRTQGLVDLANVISSSRRKMRGGRDTTLSAYAVVFAKIASWRVDMLFGELSWDDGL